MAPQIVPLVYLRRGELVRPTGPRAWTAYARTDSAAKAEAKRLFDAAQALYVWDVDGDEYGEANLEVYQAWEKARVGTWVDAGFRSVEDVMDALFAGAEGVTVRLRHLGPDGVRELAEMAEADLFLALRVEGSEFEDRMRARDVIKFAKDANLKGVVLYEGETVDFRRAEDLAFELQRNGLSAAWLARPGSPHLSGAKASARFQWVITAPEEAT